MATDIASRPNCSSPVWAVLVQEGLDQGLVSDYEDVYDERRHAKFRRGGGLVGWLGLTEDMWKTVASRFTDVEIGNALGITQAAVRAYRKRYSIRAKTTRQRRDEGIDLPNLDDLTPAKLKSLIESMPLKAVARMYRVRPPSIRYRCRKWNISVPSKSERSTSSSSLSDDQKQVVLGMLLGDAHIKENGTLIVKHGYEQFDYLLMTHKKLSNVSRPIFYRERTGDNGSLYHTFGYRTDIHPWLKEQRRIWYPNGSRDRVFPESVLNELTDMSLAYWYMDDGCYGDLPTFALGNIGDDQAEMVSNTVSRRFGFDTYVLPHSKGTNCLILGLRSSSLDNFFRRILPYVSHDLLYKLPQSLWPRDVSPKSPSKEQDSNLFPDVFVRRSKCWKDLNPTERESFLNDLITYWRRNGFPYTEPRVRDLQVLVDLDRSNLFVDDKLRTFQVGQPSVTSFQRHFWDTPSRRASGTIRETPLQHFSRDDKLRSIAIKCLNSHRVPNGSNLRSFLGAGVGVSSFRPSAAKALVDQFCPTGGLVWDPCAGWGGRMLGSLCSGRAVRYIACEPNKATFYGLQRLAKWAGQYLPSVDNRVELHNVPCEDFVPPANIDLVMTSPPYYNKEVYDTADTQSWVRYSSYEKWIEGFLAPLMARAAENLSPGGWIVLNIANVTSDGRTYPLVDDAESIARTLVLGEPRRLEYELPSAFGDSRYEPVLCWSKSPNVSVDVSDISRIGLTKCSSCGSIVARSDLQEGVCPTCETNKVKCQRCKEEIPGAIKSKLYCDTCKKEVDAERARKKRAQNPSLRTHREVKCEDCDTIMKIPLTGGVPKRCPECREKHENSSYLDARTKICAYRECGREFVDDHQNKKKHCCEEHRRREKLFRSGKITHVSQFRKPDPVLDDDAKPSIWTCRSCGEKFEKKGNDRRNRCPKCLDALRNKKCKNCDEPFRDESLNNTRQYCDKCST